MFSSFRSLFLFVLLGSVFFSCQKPKGQTSENIFKKEGQVIKITRTDDIQFAWEIMSLKKYHDMFVMMNLPSPIEKYQINSELKKRHYGLLLTLIDLQTGELISDADIEVFYSQGDSKASQKSSKLKRISGAGMHHYAITIPFLKIDRLTIRAKVFSDGIQYDNEVLF